VPLRLVGSEMCIRDRLHHNRGSFIIKGAWDTVQTF
jgi:hypothetical protein